MVRSQNGDQLQGIVVRIFRDFIALVVAEEDVGVRRVLDDRVAFPRLIGRDAHFCAGIHSPIHSDRVGIGKGNGSSRYIDVVRRALRRVVGNGHVTRELKRTIVVNTASEGRAAQYAGACSRVAGDGATRHGERAFIVDAATVASGRVAGDGAAIHVERGVV